MCSVVPSKTRPFLVWKEHLSVLVCMFTYVYASVHVLVCMRQCGKRCSLSVCHAVTCTLMWRGVPPRVSRVFTRGRQEGREHFGAFRRDIG